MITSPLARLMLLSNQVKASLATEERVLFQKGKNGVKAILNRPDKLNALDFQMYNLVYDQIDHWNKDPSIKVVLLKGAGTKAFCAGGDIRDLYEAKKTGDPNRMKLLDELFRTEYILDYEMSKLRPVTVALWNGIVMGGGVGLSVYSNIKVATENTVFAMPEAEIGFFTDVSSSYFFTRLRNHIGYMLALTGHRVRGEDVVRVGLADYFIKREKLPEIEEELLNNKDIADIKDVHSVLSKHAEAIDKKYEGEETIEKIFNKPTLKEVYEELKRTEDTEFSKNVLKLLAKQNPFSLCVIFEQLKRGKDLSLAECFKMEFRLTQRFMEGEDFFEGVRCKVIEKGGTPNWRYKSIEEVPASEVESYFKELPPEKELRI